MKYFKSLLILLLLVFVQPSYAATPTFTLSPKTGQVKLNSNFSVDITINTYGEKILLGRAAIRFDPNYLEVVKAQRNESLFCTYPESEQTVDDENGLIMVTGFCQSGENNLYKTEGESDVFARITFKPIKLGTAEIEWQYSGEDENFMSVMMKDGSPTKNVLTSSPKDGSFTIVKSISGSSSPSETPTVPETGLGISIGFVISGVLLVGIGFMYARIDQKRRVKKIKTGVIYE